MSSPGACCEVHVEVYVDKSSASHLNCGLEKLEDILVLHLAGGKDSFVSYDTCDNVGLWFKYFKESSSCVDHLV